MYHNQYEEYMRNSLGCGAMPMMNMNTMNMNIINEMYESENDFSCNQTVENMYPEIYKIIYPMVCKACMAVNENISEDLVSRIVNEIYVSVENVDFIQETRSSSQNLNLQANKFSRNDLLNNTRTNTTFISNSGSLNSKRSSNLTSNTSNEISRAKILQQEKMEGSPLLRDLIRILVLRELLGNSTTHPRLACQWKRSFLKLTKLCEL